MRLSRTVGKDNGVKQSCRGDDDDRGAESMRANRGAFSLCSQIKQHQSDLEDNL